MELIGEYYRDKVLSLPEKERKMIELPFYRPDVEIISDLFGTYLKRGKEKIATRCREEAQYIYDLWKFDLDNLWIPKDLNYLKEILPRLEVIREVHDEEIEDELSFVLSRKNRELGRSFVYKVVTLQVPIEEFLEQDEEDEESTDGTEHEILTDHSTRS